MEFGPFDLPETGADLLIYKRIRKSPEYRKLRPFDTRNVHSKTISELEQFFATSEEGSKSIVITHHAPSIRCLTEKRKDQIISAAYASNIVQIKEWQPKIWIHGHIHHTHDYHIGSTRVIANPRAYIDDPNPNFNPNLVIDLNEN